MLVYKPAPYLTFFGRRKIIPAKPPSQSECITLEDDLEARETHSRIHEATLYRLSRGETHFGVNSRFEAEVILASREEDES